MSTTHHQTQLTTTSTTTNHHGPPWRDEAEREKPIKRVTHEKRDIDLSERESKAPIFEREREREREFV